MLDSKPETRATLTQIKEHPWFLKKFEEESQVTEEKVDEEKKDDSTQEKDEENVDEEEQGEDKQEEENKKEEEQSSLIDFSDLTENTADAQSDQPTQKNLLDLDIPVDNDNTTEHVDHNTST